MILSGFLRKMGPRGRERGEVSKSAWVHIKKIGRELSTRGILNVQDTPVESSWGTVPTLMLQPMDINIVGFL
jgi:hypothetical protein